MSLLVPSLVCLSLIAAGEGIPTPQQEPFQLREWNALRNRLEIDGGRMHYLRREEGSILRGIQRLQSDLEKQQQNLHHLQENRAQLEQRVLTIGQQIDENRQQLAQMRQSVGKRATAMIRTRNFGLRTQLKSITNPGARQRTAEWFRHVVEYDAKLLSKIRSTRAEHEQLQDELTAQQTTLAATKEQAVAAYEDSQRLRRDRERLLSAVRAERGTRQHLVRELKATANLLVRDLGVTHGTSRSPALRKGGFSRQKGVLPWPAPGQVEVAFGKKVDPESELVMMQKGLDIRAPLLTVTRAVFPGRVVHAKPKKGYGNLVIVEHDRRHHTVYAHLESIRVKKGRRVRKSQIIGYVGDSGTSKGPHLYFEIRRAGKAIDPGVWLFR